MIVSAKLKGGPLDGYQTSIRQGQTVHTIRSPMPRDAEGPLLVGAVPETVAMDVAFRVGEYRQGAIVGTFEWQGWL